MSDNLPDDYWSHVNNPAHPDYKEDYCEGCEHPLSDCTCNEETEDGIDSTE